MQLLNHLRDAITPQKPGSATNIPPSDVYSILQNERRRHIIAFLATFEEGEAVAIRDVADYLQSTTADDRQNAYISIIQNHGIRFQKSQLATYDSQAKTLTPKPALQAVYEVHKAVESELN